MERFDKFVSSGGPDKLSYTDLKNNRELNHDLSSNSVKLSYVRYEDQWILGLKGSYLDCVNILNCIQNFFKQELFLELPNESVEIINTKSAKYVIFLGVRICVSYLQFKKENLRPKNRAVILHPHSIGFNHKIKNPNSMEINLEAPVNYIRGKLTKAGFLKDQKPVPKLI
jgi:hypothetical protein